MEDKSLSRQVYDRMMARDYCSQWMGVEPVLIEEGHCIISMLSLINI